MGVFLGKGGRRALCYHTQQASTTVIDGGTYFVRAHFVLDDDRHPELPPALPMASVKDDDRSRETKHQKKLDKLAAKEERARKKAAKKRLQKRRKKLQARLERALTLHYDIAEKAERIYSMALIDATSKGKSFGEIATTSYDAASAFAHVVSAVEERILRPRSRKKIPKLHLLALRKSFTPP
jgi:transcription initiation factor TFIIIB Brf1 subunit/transcription initiation factor TFIIB